MAPMPDLFHIFRWLLGIVVTVYATVVLIQSLWSWWVWLAQPDRHFALLRRYLMVHGLRLRLSRFLGEVAICVLLCVVFGLLMYAHQVVYRLGG